VRGVVAAFDITVYWTVPMPVPADPAVISIHGSFDTAVHGQSGVVVTVIEPASGLAENDRLAGAMVNRHPDAWFTVKVSPAIVIVPDRAGPVFAETV
jgi:hypothetical protein